jgi:tight adherence protein C
MLVLAVLASFGCLALLVGAAGRAATVRLAVRSTIEAAAAGVPHARAEASGEVRASVLRRVLVPLSARIAQLAFSLTPASYLANARRRLVLAGRPQRAELDRFLAARVVSLALVPVVLVVVAVVPAAVLLRVVVFGVVASLLVLGPEAALDRAVSRRKERMRVQLPDLLDVLTISVEAGLGFEQALSRAVVTMGGPLSEEFTRLLGETRMGVSRKEALRRLDERTEVEELHSFVLALLQADEFGISVAQILRSQAEDMRVALRQQVQERAQKAPVKMLFPLVFCILPAIFVVVVGPAVIEIYRTVIK